MPAADCTVKCPGSGESREGRADEAALKKAFADGSKKRAAFMERKKKRSGISGCFCYGKVAPVRTNREIGDMFGIS